MRNTKILHEENLVENIKHFSNKKICAMVKSNAYGHGMSEIVAMSEPFVDFFGVVNVDEALAVRKLTQKDIIICAKVNDMKLCKKHNFQFFVDDEADIKKALKMDLQDNLHLKINCGMNRLGIKTPMGAKLINTLLEENNICLKSICTHFPFTENRRATKKHYENFMKVRSQITQKPPICFGGSGIYQYTFPFDILRLGIGMYGYGNKNLQPVMEIRSFVSKIFYANKGEHIGYGKKYKLPSDGFFALVPIGYGDGLRRNLSGNFCVKIGEKTFPAVGNICMDCFFVKVNESVHLGDEVQVMSNAQYLANQSGTFFYEMLTGFSSLRAKTVIK